MKKLLTYLILFISITGLKAQNGEVMTIYFNSNSYEISKKDEKEIDKMIELCNSKEFYFLKIFGYSDINGKEEYNDWLSEKRCYSVWNYINKKTNIDKDKFYMAWLGESADVYDLHFEQAHPQKRCVDIWVHLDKKK